MSELNLGQRLVAKIITGLTRMSTGYSPSGLSEEWIGTMGVAGFFRFSVQGTKLIGRMSEEYGEADAQFLAGLSAALNGCGFCGYGHVITGALLHFREHGEVHPLYPRQIERMMDAEDDEAIAYLESRLDAEPFERLRGLARRMYELKMGAKPQGADDELLTAAVWLWTWTTECTIGWGLTIEPDQAQPYGHPIGKDTRLREAYQQALARVEAGGLDD